MEASLNELAFCLCDEQLSGRCEGHPDAVNTAEYDRGGTVDLAIHNTVGRGSKRRLWRWGLMELRRKWYSCSAILASVSRRGSHSLGSEWTGIVFSSLPYSWLMFRRRFR